MKITNFKDEYLPQLQELSFFMWLRVQWDSTIMRDNVFAAIDEEELLLGICALCCDGTWYYIDDERTDIPLYRLQMEVCIKEECSAADKVERELIHAAKQRLQQLKEKYPDKKLCIRCWCEEKDYHKQQQLLELGFSGHNIVWIMGFDLENTEIPQIEESEDVSIDFMENTDEAIKEYLAANSLGYDNVQDAEGELRFRLGDERTKVLVARSDGKIVSSVTTWHISDENAATENIFTIPEFRRRKVGSRIVTKSLSYLKENGYKLATLTCVGDNVRAIALYNNIGYKVVGHLLEMHWETFD